MSSPMYMSKYSKYNTSKTTDTKLYTVFKLYQKDNV